MTMVFNFYPMNQKNDSKEIYPKHNRIIMNEIDLFKLNMNLNERK